MKKVHDTGLILDVLKKKTSILVQAPWLIIVYLLMEKCF